MARITAEVKDPDDVEVSITFTMTLGRWKRLLAQVDEKPAPGWWLTGAIKKVVRKIEGEVAEEMDVSP